MKKCCLIFTYLFVFCLIFYFGYEAKINNIEKSYEFYQLYFDSFTKYFFTDTIIVVPFLYLTQINYLNPEIRIRIKNKIFEYVWLINFKNIILLSILLLCSFVISSLLFGFSDIILMVNIKSAHRLILFLLMCFVIREFVYLNTKNRFLSIGVIIFLNFIFSIIVTSYNFYININALSSNNLMNIFVIYSSLIILLGLTYLYKKMDKKEILK